MTWLFTYNGAFYGVVMVLLRAWVFISLVNISHCKLFIKNDQCSSWSGEDRLKTKVFNQSAATSLSLCFSPSHSHMSLNGKRKLLPEASPQANVICPSVYICAHTLHLLRCMRRHQSDTIWQQPRGPQSTLTHDSESLSTLPLSARTRLPSSVLCGALDGRQGTE